MLRSILKPKPNSIVRRCQEDEATKARLKYNPWYLSVEKQSGSRVWIDGRELIMMTSNDYLGLSNDPRVLEAGKKAYDEWGSGTTGARFANGTRACHLRLEEKLADFLGKEACQITAAGYLSCMTAISSFAQKGDLILVDRNVHSSLWSGIVLSGARYERFSHNNPGHLAEILKDEEARTPKLVVLEGVYSMEGHVAPLPDILQAAEGHNCFFVVDDAHGFGVMGDEGRGTVSSYGLTDVVDIVCGSFSKSLSSTGGFVAGSRDVIEFLRTYSKQTIFSAAVSPTQAACAEAALEILKSEPEHREKLWENARYYKKLLDDLGLDTWDSQTPAIPIVFGSKERAYRIWKHLFDHGVFTIPAIPPGVPPGKDLIRTAVSARHSREDLEKVAEAFAKAAKRY